MPSDMPLPIHASTTVVQHYAEIDLENIPEASAYDVADEKEELSRHLYALNKVNLFIGANNSGKSRLLRALFKAPPFRYRVSNIDFSQVIADAKMLDSEIRASLTGGILGYGPIVNEHVMQEFIAIDWFDGNKNPIEDLRRFLMSVVDNTSFSPITRSGTSPSEDTRKIHAILLPHVKRLLSAMENISLSIGGEPRVYIPVLRGLRPIQDGDAYQVRTHKDYLQQAQLPPSSTVFTGLGLYEQLFSLLLGTRAQRQSVQEYENFLQQELFEDSAVELIPRRGEDVVHLRIGEEERAIYDLGDGLQALIVITFLPFTAEQRTLFFVEELDSHLHPGMQRRLLEVLLRNPALNRHQYFVTTHSNHFLDMAADYAGCATLLVRRSRSAPMHFTVTPIESAKRLALDELGARASSVFLTNATIWVEGVTDRLYLREYLRRYLSDLGRATAIREDTHYSFMEGAGSNIAHFDFTQDSAVDELASRIRTARICSHSFVVLDGDNEGKPRLDALQRELKECLFVLKGKEIENLLPIEILRAYVLNRLPLCDVGILRLEDYHEKRYSLGHVLDEKLGTDIFSKDQTIKNKTRLCNFSVDLMRKSDAWTLTPEASRLCEQLLQFVRSSNRLHSDDAMP